MNKSRILAAVIAPAALAFVIAPAVAGAPSAGGCAKGDTCQSRIFSGTPDRIFAGQKADRIFAGTPDRIFSASPDRIF